MPTRRARVFCVSPARSRAALRASPTYFTER
jgi:hypothetical protein